MKVASILLLISGCIVAAVESSIHRGSSVGTALKLRGGVLGVDAISKKDLAKVVIGANLLDGVVGMSPKAIAKFYVAPEPERDSLAQLNWEFLGSVGLATSLMIYLALYTDMMPAKVVGIASIPCFLVGFRNVLQGVFPADPGLKMLSTFVFLPWLLTGKDLFGLSNVFLAKIYALPPLITGLMQGQLDLLFAKDFYGSTVKDPATKCVYKWVGRRNFLWGLLAQLLLAGKDPIAITGIVAGLAVLMLVDSKFITKDSDGFPDQPKAMFPTYIAVYSLVCAGLLL